MRVSLKELHRVFSSRQIDIYRKLNSQVDNLGTIV